LVGLVSFLGLPDDVNNALKTGNVAVLKNHMNSTVELVILEQENVYSNIQAEQILKQFFQKNPPKTFEILHTGGNESSKYYIGSLKTDKNTFRVYYLLKTKDHKTLIYQLRIEKDA
jgi:hypothetical protein